MAETMSTAAQALLALARKTGGKASAKAALAAPQANPSAHGSFAGLLAEAEPAAPASGPAKAEGPAGKAKTTPKPAGQAPQPEGTRDAAGLPLPGAETTPPAGGPVAAALPAAPVPSGEAATPKKPSAMLAGTAPLLQGPPAPGGPAAEPPAKPGAAADAPSKPKKHPAAPGNRPETEDLPRPAAPPALREGAERVAPAAQQPPAVAAQVQGSAKKAAALDTAGPASPEPPRGAAQAELPAPKPAEPVTAPRVVEQLAVAIVRKAEGGTTRFQIRLDPPELGRIDVRLELGADNRAQAHLTVERGATLDLLARDQRALEQALRQSGLDLGQGALSFTLAGEDGGRHDAKADAAREADANAPPQVPPEDDLPEAAEPRAHVAASHGLIDLRV